MTMKDYGAFFLVSENWKSAPASETLSITNSDDAYLHSCSPEKSLLMIQRADAFIKNKQKAFSFHTNAFSSRAEALFNELYIREMEQSKEQF